MNLILFLLLAALFVALTPGVLVSLPKGGKRLTVAAVHGLLFALIWSLIRSPLARLTSVFDIQIGGRMMEAMENETPVEEETEEEKEKKKKAQEETVV